MDALRARITELERALVEAEHKCRKIEAIIDAAPGILWESQGKLGTPEYRVTYVSRQVENILGYGRDEWVQPGAFWLSVIHPEDKPKIAQASREIARSGGNPPEHRLIAKDGRAVWVEPYVRIIQDASGAPIGRSILVLDVTARRQAQQAHTELLAQAQSLTRRLDNLVASMPGVVWEAQGGPESALAHMSFVSPALTAMTGYSLEEAIGNPAFWQSLVHPDDQERVSSESGEIYANGGGTIQLRWVTKEGRTLWVESHVRVVRDDAGLPTGAYGVTMDITGRKLAEQAEATLKDEVINAQAAVLAQLGTPLIPISSDVLVMPLIGMIDSQRAGRVIEALLDGIAKAGVRVAIVDVTGVPSVDTQTADTLLRAARAVKLLGAEVVITGIHPEVARTLVILGIDLQGIVTRGTLQAGIAYATRRA